MFTEALLDIRGLCTGYSDAEVLHDVDLTVGAGEIVAVLGANGVGKSTLNRTISGVVRAWSGTIRFGGVAIEREKPAAIVARGLIHVPEGRRIFPNLSVQENLDLGSYRRAAARRAANRARVFEIFPRLHQRRSSATTRCSKRCPRASSSFRAPVFRTIWPTRRVKWAFASGIFVNGLVNS